MVLEESISHTKYIIENTQLITNDLQISKVPSLTAQHEQVLIHHKIEYGVFYQPSNRVPLVMIHRKLDDDVHQAFLNQPLFQCKSESDLINYNMIYAIDYPRSKDTHFYYEGYSHAFNNNTFASSSSSSLLLLSSTVWSRNPRSGKDFAKPITTLFLYSFYESFRQINRNIFNQLKIDLYHSALKRQPNSPYDDICGLLSSWIENNLHFSDLSIQIHYGSHIQKDELFWHTDAENSLLHFGITVHGTRILHSKRAKSVNGEVSEILEVQTPGDVYLSSSALMNHAPEYPFSTWNDTRIIAIQSRILYTTYQLKLFRKLKTDESWIELTTILANSLANAELKLPTMKDIQSIMMLYI